MRLELDRDSTVPVWEQVAQQVRFQIATGRIASGSLLPSTRALGSQLGISFHTVRRAYQHLVTEGLAAASPGRGFEVASFTPAAKHEQIEKGAAVVADAVRKLAALGLEEGDMEYLLQEQLSELSQGQEAPKMVFVASYTEFAEAGARRISDAIGASVEAVPLSLLDAHQDAEYVIAPFPIARQVREVVPRSDVLGVRTVLPAAAVSLASRLYEYETLLLVVRYSDAIGALSRRLRNDAGYSGQIIAAVMEEGESRLGTLVRQADGVMFTPDTERRMRPHLAAAPSNAKIELLIDDGELTRLRDALPG